MPEAFTSAAELEDFLTAANEQQATLAPDGRYWLRPNQRALRAPGPAGARDRGDPAGGDRGARARQLDVAGVLLRRLDPRVAVACLVEGALTLVQTRTFLRQRPGAPQKHLTVVGTVTAFLAA